MVKRHQLVIMGRRPLPSSLVPVAGFERQSVKRAETTCESQHVAGPSVFLKDFTVFFVSALHGLQTKW